MTDEKKPARLAHGEQAAADRLRKLNGDLKKAYDRAADHIAESLRAIEEAVAEINETWAPTHYAEALRKGGPTPAQRPATCFAHETFANGDQADYLLCVARDRDRHCGLHVSYCQYNVLQTKNDFGRTIPKVTIRDTFLLLPGKLPVPLRLKILDVLDAFAEGYEAHVRSFRNDILGRFGEHSAFDGPVVAREAPPLRAEAAEPAGKADGAPFDSPAVREPEETAASARLEISEAKPENVAPTEAGKNVPKDDAIKEDIPDPLAVSPRVVHEEKPKAEEKPVKKPLTMIELKDLTAEVPIAQVIEPAGDARKRDRRTGGKSADIDANLPLQAWI